jgi:hypothetical protein
MGLHAADGYLRAMAHMAATVATVLPLEVIARSAIEWWRLGGLAL